MGHAESSLRPVDLARRAGVSTQQVRNLETAGVLPDAPRTPSGYRRYGPQHLDALLTYRALSAGHGISTAQAIMRAVHRGDAHAALSLVDAGHAALHEQRRALEAAGETLEAVAGEDPRAVPAPRSGMLVGELAAALGVRTSTLRVWESAGLLAPTREPGTTYRRYLPDDVRDARIIHLLRQGRYFFAQIRPVLDGLRRTGGTASLRAAIAERHAALNRQTAAMLEGAGLLHQRLTEAGLLVGAAPALPSPRSGGDDSEADRRQGQPRSASDVQAATGPETT
ncbi:MerR family transcriptional regulator [Nocardiopsis ansamitocini]|uniref:MerR family transcriptional regulator n=1 Tax=Nocardiopsis ansamitocini TaxID=1670832 RepID=A0A9W6PB08_9ACTN|nr:MerR family transcriptional regulator [Nocardiopsis ansamitocini]GLU50274.1 MerR family transcriptional regulator [Nocardiopsis ansamitocini]